MKKIKLKLIAKESALTTNATKKYIRFMKLRFPLESDEDYASEWAERFAKGTDWNSSDKESKKILIKIKRRSKEGDLID